MRRNSPFNNRKSSVDLNLTPMIDCVFLLMVYFIWASSTGVMEYWVEGAYAPPAEAAGNTAPSETPPPEADFDEVVVRILATPAGPAWLLNEAPIPSLAALQPALANIARIKRDAPVIVHPDGAIGLGHAIDVYDLARSVGFEKVRFAANEEAG